MSSRIHVILLGWISMIATDFLIHGGVLAFLYTKESPFLLPARDAFVRIPLGYFSFLMLAMLLFYLFKPLKIGDRKQGFKAGLMLGIMIWASLCLGLLSISTADPLLLLGWFVGQSVEMAIAGYFMGWFYEGAALKKIWKWVAIYFIIMISFTIVLQSVGWAPAMEMK
jgi:hypothetical protein